MKSLKLVTALTFLTLGAQAGVISAVGTRAGLGANDTVQWGIAANDGTFVASPYNVVSTGGVSVSAILATGLAIFVQNGPGGYTGAFSPGDILLDSALSPGPITIDFATAVRAVGFNISTLNFGAFTGRIEFFGAGNVSFGFLTTTGISSSANNGSAPFLGGSSSLTDITRVVVSTSGAGTELTINRLSLVTAAIPEPATISLFSAAMAGAWLLRRRRP